MATANWLFSGLMVLLSLVVLMATGEYPSGDAESGYGPGLFPNIIVFVILLLSAGLAYSTWREKNKASLGFTLSSLRMPALLTVMIAIYGLVMLQFLGFLAATTIFLFGAMAVLKTPYRTAALLSPIMSGVIYVAFKIILKVPLPIGTIFGG